MKYLAFAFLASLCLASDADAWRRAAVRSRVVVRQQVQVQKVRVVEQVRVQQVVQQVRVQQVVAAAVVAPVVAVPVLASVHYAAAVAPAYCNGGAASLRGEIAALRAEMQRLQAPAAQPLPMPPAGDPCAALREEVRQLRALIDALKK